MWTVNQIVLHLAPLIPPAEPYPTAVTGRKPAPARGPRIMNAAQIYAEFGAERAAALGVNVPGSIPDYTQGELRPVDQVLMSPPRIFGIHQRYLLDLERTNHDLS